MANIICSLNYLSWLITRREVGNKKQAVPHARTEDKRLLVLRRRRQRKNAHFTVFRTRKSSADYQKQH